MRIINDKTPVFATVLAACGVVSGMLWGQAIAAPAESVVASFEGPWVASAVSQSLKTSDGKALPLLPAAKKMYEQNQAQLKQGKNGIDPLARCLPTGIPRLYGQSGPFRLAIGDRFAGMFFESQHLFRVITMYRNHFEAIAPGYLGQAVGKWEGNTLVVDSDQFNDATLLDDVGLPHSDELHLVERISVPADGKLHIAMTLTDPKTFSKPFKTEFVFDKQADRQFKEDFCLQRQGLLSKD